MKKQILLFTLSLFILSCATDPIIIENNPNNNSIDKIFVGDVLLVTQAEINAFAAQNYTGITGFLRIEAANQTAITDIAALNTLTKVSEGLSVDNTNLTSLNGLQNINKPMAVAISITNNPLLENLDQLNGISNVPGEGIRVFIHNNVNLNSITGLEKVTRTRFLEIVDNPVLESLTGLHNIESASSLSISLNASLTSLLGLEQLTQTESLIINKNKNLLTLNGMDNFEKTQIMSIVANDNLNDLTGLTTITFPVSAISITGNPVLSSLDGLENIPFIDHVGVDGFVAISGNINLTNLCALQKSISSSEINLPLSIIDNLFNPTLQNIIDGNCSQ